MVKRLTNAEKEIIRLLEDKIAEIDNLELRKDDFSFFYRWRDEVGAILRNAFGANEPQRRLFDSVAYPGYEYTIFDSLQAKKKIEQQAIIAALPEMRDKLKAVIYEIENFGIPSLGISSTVVTVPSVSLRYRLSSPVYWFEWLLYWVKKHPWVATLIFSITGGIVATIILRAIGIL